MQRAIDGDHIALAQHLLQTLHPPTPDFLLLLGAQGLVIEVQELFAVERLESPQHTLANPPDSYRPHDFALEVIFILCRGSNVPLAGLDLLMRRHEIAD